MEGKISPILRLEKGECRSLMEYLSEENTLGDGVVMNLPANFLRFLDKMSSLEEKLWLFPFNPLCNFDDDTDPDFTLTLFCISLKHLRFAIGRRDSWFAEMAVT